MQRVLLTGGAGFIGSHMLRYLLAGTDWEIVCTERTRPVPFEHERIVRIPCDLARKNNMRRLYTLEPVDYVISIASEADPHAAMRAPAAAIAGNVAMITNLMEWAREMKPTGFWHLSTDEVYGAGQQIPVGAPHHPRSPYAGGKAAQESVIRSYRDAFGVPAWIANTQNIFGQRQPASKFIPTAVRSLLAGNPVPLVITPDAVPVRRPWMHADNVADALLHLIENYVREDVHITSSAQQSNERVVSAIAEHLGITPVIEPTLDKRRGMELAGFMDPARMRELDWLPPYQFTGALHATIDWYTADPVRYAL